MGQGIDALLPLMAQLEQQYKLPPGILQKIAGAETGHIKDWDKRISATSPKGAQGLMQFMPGTAQQYSVDPLNPESAIRGAARYLNDAKAIIGSDDPRMLLAAYNAGPNHKSLRQGQVPNIAETQQYVARAMGEGGYTPPSQGLLAQMGSTPIMPQQTQWNPTMNTRNPGAPTQGQRPMPEAPKGPATMTDEEFARYKKRYQEMQQLQQEQIDVSGAATAGLGALAGVPGYKDVSEGARDGFKRMQGLLAMIMGGR